MDATLSLVIAACAVASGLLLGLGAIASVRLSRSGGRSLRQVAGRLDERSTWLAARAVEARKRVQTADAVAREARQRVIDSDGQLDEQARHVANARRAVARMTQERALPLATWLQRIRMVLAVMSVRRVFRG